MPLGVKFFGFWPKMEKMNKYGNCTHNIYLKLQDVYSAHFYSSHNFFTLGSSLLTILVIFEKIAKMGAKMAPKLVQNG